MVTETETPVEEVDQAPPEEQTEVPAPQVEDAAEPQEEAAADRVAALEARLREIEERAEREKAEAAEQARQDAVEEVRRQNQIRQQAIAKEQQRESESKARALREAKLHLHEQGLTDIAPEAISPAFESYVSDRKQSIRQSALQDVADAWSIASAKYFGQSIPSDISPTPEAFEYASRYQEFAQSFGTLVSSRVEADMKAKGWKAPEEVAAAIEAARKDERAKLRPQEDLATVEGALPSAGGEMTQARWDALTPAERADHKNQAAYDEWCRKNP